jgi:hypothetical protein
MYIQVWGIILYAMRTKEALQHEKPSFYQKKNRDRGAAKQQCVQWKVEAWATVLAWH